MAILSGNVTDRATGKPIVGAVVKVGNSTTTTSRVGSYRFLNLKPGQYPMQVTASGYSKVVL